MLGYRGVDDEPLMSENDGYDKWVRELAASGASLPEIAAKLAEAAKARTESHASSKLTVNKITWAQVGLVTEPGRHMFKLGWLTITADDLTVWKQYPGASFTLCSMAARTPAGDQTDKEAAEEFRVGIFDLRILMSPSAYRETAFRRSFLLGSVRTFVLGYSGRRTGMQTND